MHPVPCLDAVMVTLEIAENRYIAILDGLQPPNRVAAIDTREQT
jgi:hypothetical protein